MHESTYVDDCPRCGKHIDFNPGSICPDEFQCYRCDTPLEIEEIEEGDSDFIEQGDYRLIERTQIA